MPYIPQEQRPEIDAIVDPLVRRMAEMAEWGNYTTAMCLRAAIMRISQGLCLGYLPHTPASPWLRDSDVDPLIELLNAVGDNDEITGRLNYAISRVVWSLCGHCGRGVRRYARMNALHAAIDLARDDFRRWFSPPCVHRAENCLAEREYVVIGAVGLAQAEFRRRMVDPYEDEKIRDAGDVS